MHPIPRVLLQPHLIALGPFQIRVHHHPRQYRHTRLHSALLIPVVCHPQGSHGRCVASPKSHPRAAIFANSESKSVPTLHAHTPAPQSHLSTCTPCHAGRAMELGWMAPGRGGCFNLAGSSMAEPCVGPMAAGVRPRDARVGCARDRRSCFILEVWNWLQKRTCDCMFDLHTGLDLACPRFDISRHEPSLSRRPVGAQLDSVGWWGALFAQMFSL
ncbi:hypothetical protein FIBSPDRAFT_260822 [Athelia psychrophila]|uniref:Uncharacterized protein n=1 Tax=Athelia psychrophila TaxID=1759441 RepID=A0A166RQV2_9AGAM|nr:hypothetical protein FIBSPDRAFT_260822 [Fibularhizoctonia sp. CBS 109695]